MGSIVAPNNKAPAKPYWISTDQCSSVKSRVLNLNDAILRLRDSGTPSHRVRRAGKPLVLVVDDIVEQRELYEYFLAQHFELASAARGPEAIAIAVARQPDAIVLDVEMPEMNGIEVCRRLKRHKETAAIPVLMLTGTPRDVHAQAREAGAAAVLEKPCSVDALLEHILGSIITAQASTPTGDEAA